MFRTILTIACCLALTTSANAKQGHPDIVVMTQNQYLGTDLVPITSATTIAEYNAAMLDALSTVANNRFHERAVALAESITDRKPHLVGLQEVFHYECIETGSIPGACDLFAAAMNDHLDMTLDALDSLGADYYVAGVVRNFSSPGFPIFLDADATPDVLIAVFDRDVILARGDVAATPVEFGCSRPSLDGCNYEFNAAANTLAGPIEQTRGFVAVDATVDGADYRFVNTHLEVRYPAPQPDAPLVQAIQASELLGTLSLSPPPAGAQLLVVGDFNSSPLDPVFVSSLGPTRPPYMQMVTGESAFGAPISLPYTDTWDLRPGKPPGYTCCEASDLSNLASMHDERIDLVLSLQAPSRVKANVLNNDAEDKTPSGLWPSDHASVVTRLNY